MNQNKHYLKVLILPLFFVFSSNMAMFNLFMQNLREQQEQTKKLKALQQLTTITAVDHEIDTLKNSIYDELLKEFKDAPFYAKNKFDKQRTFIKNSLQQNTSNITQTHNENIPSSMYNDIVSVLQKENVNPQNIKLDYIKSDKWAATASDGLYWNKIPEINIYEVLSGNSKADQMWVYHHELQHIFLIHHSICQYAHRINNDSTYKNVASIVEREANIHAASKNSEIAHAGMIKTCCWGGHPHIIDNKRHCHEMEMIYTLVLQKERLSQKESL